MRSNIWIPIEHIQDQEPIWAGTRIRMFELSQNGVEQNEQKQNKAEHSEQYMEYLLSYIHGNSDELQLTCLTQGRPEISEQSSPRTCRTITLWLKR